jgi:hypothetical protein
LLLLLLLALGVGGHCFAGGWEGGDASSRVGNGWRCWLHLVTADRSSEVGASREEWQLDGGLTVYRTSDVIALLLCVDIMLNMCPLSTKLQDFMSLPYTSIIEHQDNRRNSIWYVYLTVGSI